MFGLLQEFRFALRNLRRRPGVASMLVVILALGIGANTAIFSIIHAVLIRPLGYGNAERVAIVWEKRRKEGTRTNGVTPADYLDWRAQNHAFSTLTAHDERPFILSGLGEPERVLAVLATPDMLATYDVSPAMGRGFVPADETQGARVALLSWGFWQRRFGGQRAALGQTIRLDDAAYAVVGVMPASFQMYFGGVPDVYVPLVLEDSRRADRGSHDLLVVGRLRPGIGADRAQAEMDAISARLERQWPATNTGHGANIVPIRAQVTEALRPLLLMLAGAALLVLLIACANAANLILARGLSRRRELSIREALGAGRARIVRLLVIESLATSLVAGGVGCGLAFVLLESIRPLLPRIAGISWIPGLDSAGINPAVLLFAAGASILTGFLCGLAPALSNHSGHTTFRLRDGLVVLETALASVLLIGATLLLYSFACLTRVNPGFEPHERISVELVLPTRLQDPAHRNVAYRQILEAAQSMPNVRSAALTNFTPGATVGWRWGLRTDTHPEQRSIEDSMKIWMRVVSPGFLPTMGIPILQGRGLTDQDTDHAARVVLLSDTAARRYFPGLNAIGRRIALGDQKIWRTVAGITGSMKHRGLNREPEPEVYVPYAQLDMPAGEVTLILHTEGDASQVVDAARQTVGQVDRALAFGRVESIDDLLGESLAPERFDTVLIALFAGVAFLLAVAGLASVIAFLVSQETRNIAVRLAIGARPGQVAAYFTSHAMRLVALGLGLGIFFALLLSRLLQAYLFGVSATAAFAYVVPAAALFVAALFAAFIPARRAAGIDPVTALRHE